MTQKNIRIIVNTVEAVAELNFTKTAESIWEALPIEGFAQTWGDEIYFGIPLALPLENGQEVVEIGDLGYWPPGKAFCIFFGPTPASIGNEVRPAGPVNVLGKITGDATIFRNVKEGSKVLLEKGQVS